MDIIVETAMAGNERSVGCQEQLKSVIIAMNTKEGECHCAYFTQEQAEFLSDSLQQAINENEELESSPFKE